MSSCTCRQCGVNTEIYNRAETFKAKNIYIFYIFIYIYIYIYIYMYI